MTRLRYSKPRLRLRSHGVEKSVVMMAAIHPVQRPIVNRLQTVLDRKIRAAGKFLKKIENIVWHTVGTRANGQSHDGRMRDRRFVQRTRSFSTGA